MPKGLSCRSLALLASSSVLALNLTAAPVAVNLSLDQPVLKVALADSGSSCFVAGTRVLMADGTEKPIERIAIGDRVMGRGGRINRVTGIERPRLGGRRLHAFNGGRPFVTAEHPFFTRAGWRAIDPEATAAENPSLSVGALAVGDLLAVVRCGGLAETRGATALAAEPELGLAYMRLDRLESVTADPEMRVYNLLLDGDHAYFAGGFLVHNKGGDGGGDGGGGDGGGGDDGGGDGSNSGPGSENSGPGSENSGPGSSSSGPGGEGPGGEGPGGEGPGGEGPGGEGPGGEGPGGEGANDDGAPGNESSKSLHQHR